MRKIVIAGGSGFLGNILARFFADNRDQVIVLSRQEIPANRNISFRRWDGKTLGEWAGALEGADVLINLTGKNVNCRYTRKNRKEILDSRLESTSVLGTALRQVLNPPAVWLNASSATIYNASYTNIQTEESDDIGDDFSMTVCKHWEHTFNNFRIPGVRKVIARIGIVLGKTGGAFVPLRNLAMFGFGGRQGNGDQYMSWIHQRDFCNAINLLVSNSGCKGVYNVTAPEPICNREFMNVLQRTSEISIAFPLPKTILAVGAIFIRTETELVLKSRKVFPKRLLDEGFVFEFNDAKTALNNLCRTEAIKSSSNILSLLYHRLRFLNKRWS
jgi:uncharacterized protein